MLTRLTVSHPNPDPVQPGRIITPGAMADRPLGAFNAHKPNIVARMPIARPNSSPVVAGAPFYLGPAYQYNQGGLIGGGAVTLSPAKPNLEMDPSDQTTWQRAYSFT